MGLRIMLIYVIPQYKYFVLYSKLEWNVSDCTANACTISGDIVEVWAQTGWLICIEWQPYKDDASKHGPHFRSFIQFSII